MSSTPSKQVGIKQVRTPLSTSKSLQKIMVWRKKAEDQDENFDIVKKQATGVEKENTPQKKLHLKSSPVNKVSTKTPSSSSPVTSPQKRKFETEEDDCLTPIRLNTSFHLNLPEGSPSTPLGSPSTFSPGKRLKSVSRKRGSISVYQDISIVDLDLSTISKTKLSSPSSLFDCYGFYLFAEEDDRDELTEEEQSRKAERIEIKLQEKWDPIPFQSIRTRWLHFLNLDQVKMFAGYQFQVDKFNLQQTIDEYALINNALWDKEQDPSIAVILQDIPRTYPNHVLYCDPHGSGRQRLFNVLVSYSEYDKVVGYCQGMAYIAGALLMFMSDEEAFWALTVLVSNPKYLKGFFDEDLKGLVEKARIFDEILLTVMPEVHSHLNEAGMQSVMFITPWFMRAFTGLENWETGLFLFDKVIQGGYRSMLCGAISILDCSKDPLMRKKGIAEILPFLLNLNCQQLSLLSVSPHYKKWETTTLTFNKIDQIAQLACSKWESTSTPSRFHRTPAKHRVPASTEKSKSKNPDLIDKILTPIFKREKNSVKAPLSSVKKSRQDPSIVSTPGKVSQLSNKTLDLIQENEQASQNKTEYRSPLAFSPTSVQSFKEFATPTAFRHKQPTIVDSPSTEMGTLTPLTPKEKLLQLISVSPRNQMGEVHPDLDQIDWSFYHTMDPMAHLDD